jgi:hypothetical protein
MPDSLLRQSIDIRFRRVQFIQSMSLLLMVFMLGAIVLMGFMQGRSAARGNRILKELSEAKRALPLAARLRCTPLHMTGSAAGRATTTPTPLVARQSPSTVTR